MGTDAATDYESLIQTNLTVMAPVVKVQGDYLTLTYQQNKEATGLTYTVEACDSLSTQNWTAATTELARIDAGTYWTVTVQDNATISSSGNTRFMRLKVTKP